MKLSTVIGGLAAAFALSSAAHAGSLDIFYGGKDGAATVAVDGTLHDVGASNQYWGIVTNIYEGSHTVVLHANGGTTRTDLTFSTGNAAYPGDSDGPAWCIDLEDNGATLLNGDGCDEMLDYWMFGGDDSSN